MTDPVTLSILLGNFLLSYILFSYQRTVRDLTMLAKSIRSLLYPNWFYLLFAIKILALIATSIYFINEGIWIYIIYYLIISSILNAILPIPFSFHARLVEKYAKKQVHKDPELLYFISLVFSD
jgi:hypothetical protein